MPTRQSVTGRFLAVTGFAVIVCAGCTEAGPIPPNGILQINGVLTGEGVECPALRGDDGQLYTLAGDLAGASLGDQVCVDGQLVEISICQQGITLEIKQIASGYCE